jgi:xanthine/CO dehydrogenase XdhC/CoxF family maturation factor
MSSLSEELVQISEQGAAAVLATVIEVEGNGRVEAGAKCLVRDDQVRAETIGDAKVVRLRRSAARIDRAISGVRLAQGARRAKPGNGKV